MIVTVESSGKVVSQTMKGMVHREAPVVVRSKLSEYLRCLKEGMYTPPGIYWNIWFCRLHTNVLADYFTSA